MLDKNALIDAAIESLGLGMTAVFIPWSQSRNYKKDAKLSDYSLNWKITFYKNGREFMNTFYSAGIGHCKNQPKIQGKPTIYESNQIIAECEARSICEGGITRTKPNPRDVFYSIVADSDVLDHGSFEDWASDYGYDQDSRKAEAIYRLCLAHALAIKASLGDEGLKKLQEVYRDY